jgi:hypothetical protein
MPVLHRDFETASAAPLKKVGARRYAADPTTRVLCICYAVDGGPIESFIPDAGKPVPDVFIEAARNPDWFVAAHNDAFESAVEGHVLAPRHGWPLVPIERHICTMAMARYHGLPGELGKMAALLNLKVQKDREGARLMLKLCKPRKPRKGEDPTQIYWPEITPEDLARLVKYCCNDVAVEREAFFCLPCLPEDELRLWCLDRKINMRGFCGDLELAHAAGKLVQAEKNCINAKMRAVTAGAVEGFTKLNSMREFVNARGHDMTKANKRAIAAVLSHEPDDIVREVLELRQASSNTAVEKYRAVIVGAFPDQRIRGLLNYYGTHTGRWTSAGFNVHNLPREDSADALAVIAAIRSGDLEAVRAFGPPLDVIAGAARGLVIAAPGKLLLAGDFTTIEPRGASWFADEKWKLDSFRAFDETGDPLLDPYRILGARMRGVEVDPNDGKARQHGKTVTMAFNYGASVRVWRAFVPDDSRSDEEIKAQEVDKFRQLHPAQTRFMYDLDKQALRCVRSRQPLRYKRHGFEMDGDTLILRLPSGRPLFYPRAHIRPGKFGRDVVAYHNPAKNRVDEMWYGAWLAHLVSSTSRDLLVNALFNLDAAGFDIVLHVHDEIVAEIDPSNAERDRERFKTCMLQAPEWADGWPLAAKVRVGPRYLKADEPTPNEIAPKLIEAEPIAATQIAASQLQVGFFGATEIPDDTDKRTSEAPNGSAFEHNPVPGQNGGAIPEAHICAQCGRNPPDGGERPSLHGELWLHAGCEEAFIHARMTEEGIPWEVFTTAAVPTLDPEPESPPPSIPPSEVLPIAKAPAMPSTHNPRPTMPPLSVELTRLTKADGPLTKRISLTADGTIVSDGSACVMWRGTAERVKITGVDDFAGLIGNLDPSQAIALGVLRPDLPDKVEIVTKRKSNGAANVIARTGVNIVYRGPAFALFDFDAKGMSPAVAAELQRLGGFWAALRTVLPDLGGAAYVTRRSTTTGLSRVDTGQALPGSDGVHIYIEAKDGADVDRFLKTLHDRCWLRGLGWMIVGAAGVLLERSIVDRMVGAPERLVFEGGPILMPPLQQDQNSRRPIAVNGEMLDTVASCPPLSIVERARLDECRAREKERLASEAARVRAAFVAVQAKRLTERTGKSEQAARKIVERQCDGVLHPDIELPFDDPDLAGCTVGDVLADPERFVGETLADPLEGVEYGRCKAKIMRRPDGTPWIHSFAHGRTIYALKLNAERVRKALEAADKAEVVPTLAKLAVDADLDPVEQADLRQAANELSGIGLRVISATLKAAQQKRDQQARTSRAVLPQDPRPLISAPSLDDPWLPQIEVLNEITSKVTAAIPPSRNVDEVTGCMHEQPNEEGDEQ